MNLPAALSAAALAGLLLASCGKEQTLDKTAAAAPETIAANAAWARVLEASKSTPMPEAWRKTPPAALELAEFKQQHATRMLEGAELARSFYQRFPKDKYAAEAKRREFSMLEMAFKLGHTNLAPRMTAIATEIAADASAPEDQRFEMRARQVQAAAQAVAAQGPEAVTREFEKGVRALQKEFPTRPELSVMLLMLAQFTEGEKSRSIAQEVVDSPTAPPEVKAHARSMLLRFEFEGKPLKLQFTATDGTAVDLDKLRGKVVLVDFWATWCQPCVEELPKVKAAHAKFNARGFEIIGISLDTKLDALKQFTAKEGMTWPQHCDTRSFDGPLPKQFGISSIPALWLVDKKGIVRDLNARENLEAKVEKLLAE